tara:strand:- start:99 stop:332 length:234 start_codon:yes stop_codon:yes gene_type:complete
VVEQAEQVIQEVQKVVIQEDPVVEVELEEVKVVVMLDLFLLLKVILEEDLVMVVVEAQELQEFNNQLLQEHRTLEMD